MKKERFQKRIVMAAIAVLVLMISSAPGRAQQPAKPNGPVAIDWDINNDGTYDQVSFATIVTNNLLC